MFYGIDKWSIEIKLAFSEWFIKNLLDPSFDAGKHGQINMVRMTADFAVLQQRIFVTCLTTFIKESRTKTKK